MTNPSTEYRIVCAKIKISGHKSHTWLAKDRATADKRMAGTVEDLDRTPQGHWRLNEYPYKIQTRTVTKWVDAE